MQPISYTFPSNCPIADLRGVTATGGHPGHHKGEAVVIFDRIKGHPVIARIAGKPELDRAVAAYRAQQVAEARAEQEAKEAREAAHPGLAERERLAETEYNTYSPEHFPGSAKWRANKLAADALAAFDAAHPDLVAFLRGEKAARDKARYDSLSDFVKAGS